MIPRTKQTTRRSLGARASALRTVAKFLSGAKRVQDVRESERNELLACVEQAAEFLERCDAEPLEIATLLTRGRAG